MNGRQYQERGVGRDPEQVPWVVGLHSTVDFSSLKRHGFPHKHFSHQSQKGAAHTRPAEKSRQDCHILDLPYFSKLLSERNTRHDFLRVRQPSFPAKFRLLPRGGEKEKELALGIFFPNREESRRFYVRGSGNCQSFVSGSFEAGSF